MDKYYKQIKEIQYEIDLCLQKIAFYKELDELRTRLIKKYQEIKEKYSHQKDEYSLKKYFAILSSFYEEEISIANNLLLSKKINKSIYDNSEEDIDLKIETLLNKLTKEISILLEKFPLISKNIQKELAKTVAYYQGEIATSKELTKKNIYTKLGIVKYEDTIILGFGEMEDLNKSFYRSLQAIDNYSMPGLRIIIENDQKIDKIATELLIYDIFKESINSIINEYHNHLEEISNDIFTSNTTYSKISNLQQNTLNKLNNIHNEYARLKDIDKIYEYLNNLTYENLDYDKLIKLADTIKNIDSEGQLLDYYYQILYLIIVIEKYIYKESILYNMLDKGIKVLMEKRLLDELLIEQDEENYQNYLRNGFMNSLSNLEQVLLNKFATKKIMYLNCYDEITLFHEEFAIVRKNGLLRENGLYGYIDKTGKEIIPCKYKEENSFSEGLAVVRKDSFYGYIDKTGKEIIPCQYKDAYSFSEGLALVKKDDFYGYIDKTGKEIIPCQYKDAYSFSEGLAVVRKDSLYGYIDKTGKEKISCQYVYAYSFSEGLALVSKDGFYGYIDKTGEEIIKCQYQRAKSFQEGLALVRENGLYGYIDKTGEEIIKCQYKVAKSFQEDLALVKKNDLYGYIDKTGKEVIKFQYISAESFSEGLALVRENGLYGYIDKTGEEIIKCQYKVAKPFQEDLALVEFADDQKIFIDKAGNPLQKKTFKGKISDLITEMKHENHKKLIKIIDNIRINK